MTMSLKAARVNAGLNQKQAAKKLGLAYQTLSRYENDLSVVTVGTILKMCDLYDTDVNSLLSGARIEKDNLGNK